MPGMLEADGPSTGLLLEAGAGCSSSESDSVPYGALQSSSESAHPTVILILRSMGWSMSWLRLVPTLPTCSGMETRDDAQG